MENASKERNEISLLKEILKWIKFAGMKEVKTILTNELESDPEKVVYQNSGWRKRNG